MLISLSSLLRGKETPGASRSAQEVVNYDCYKYRGALDWLVFLFFSFLSLRQEAEEVHPLSLTYVFLDTWLEEKPQRRAERGLREEVEGSQSQNCYPIGAGRSTSCKTALLVLSFFTIVFSVSSGCEKSPLHYLLFGAEHSTKILYFICERWF